MVAILEKTEHNTDFHQIVDFLDASHIRIETTYPETKIIATADGKSWTISKSSLRRHLKLNDEEGISSLPDAKLFEDLSLMGYNILPNQSNIVTAVVCLATNRVYNFSKMIFDGMVRNINNEPASLSRNDRHGEAFLTVSSLYAGQDRENIAKTSAMPHESSPRVPSLDANEDSMQQRIHELIELYTILQRLQSQMVAKIKYQDLEISGLKARGIKDIREELGANKSTELGSNDTKEMVNVLSSMEAANILSSGGAAASVSPADVLPTAGVPTVSGSFTTTSMVTPYTRRSRGIIIRSSQPMRIPIISAKDKGKEKVIETEVPKKKKLQEQIDAQVAREIEEGFSQKNQRLSEQVARDSEIARMHAEEELKLMIEGLDRSNEVIAKHLSEYEQAKADLSVGEKIELISELVKYQAQQTKPLSKKEQREFYMSVLGSHTGWKTKHFKGMTLEQIKEKFIPVWKQWEDFIPVFNGIKEELKGMMQLVPLKEVYIKALQVKHPIIDWEIHIEGKREYWKIIRLGGHTEAYHNKQPIRDKEKELWVELERMFEPDSEDQLWIYDQAFMHDPLDWKLYDICGVHHVSTKNQEIFMLVEKDYPLRKGLATVMIIQDEELFEASSLGEFVRFYLVQDSLAYKRSP
nr:hypothetical protein [Tanacetum cinerariifolium]